MVSVPPLTGVPPLPLLLPEPELPHAVSTSPNIAVAATTAHFRPILDLPVGKTERVVRAAATVSLPSAGTQIFTFGPECRRLPCRHPPAPPTGPCSRQRALHPVGMIS